MSASRGFNLQASSSGIVVLMAAIPLLFVIYTSLYLPVERWFGLWDSRLPELIGNTLLLVVMVAGGCFMLGVSTAWIISRRSFPGSKIAVWLMVVPLTIPTYVFAYIYTALLEEKGWLGRLWLSIFNDLIPIPDLYNVFGVALILSLSGFTYVFLMTYAALQRSNPHIEEAARLQTKKNHEVFWRISLPLLRPAIAAGLAVVTLHVLSDFGAVSMLRYQTFTLSIYLQMSGRFDYQSAAGLSFILLCFALTFLVFERVFRSRQRYYSSIQVKRRDIKQATNGELVIIWGVLGVITFFSIVLPFSWLVAWSWDAWVQDVINVKFWGYLRNSFLIAFVAACLTVVLALPIGLYHARSRNTLSAFYFQMSSIGFVLPGPVVALGVLVFILAWLPGLYGGLTALAFALIVRFLPLAVQSQEAAMQQLTPAVEDAGKVLGAGPIENFWRVILPMVKGGIASAWVLVFIDILKELPATLIMRPIGFDTLPVRIWIEASEEMLEFAAPASLLLILASMPALWVIMRGNTGN